MIRDRYIFQRALIVMLLLTGMVSVERIVIAQESGLRPTSPGNRLPTSQADVSPKAQSAQSGEAWFRIDFDGQPVGYETVTSSELRSDSKTSRLRSTEPAMIRRVRDTVLRLRRFGNDLSVTARLECVESESGLLHSWSLRRTGGDGSTVTRAGTWSADRGGFEVREEVTGVSQRELIPSPVQPRSPVIPFWIRNAAGERAGSRTFAVYFPETAAVADIDIRNSGAQSLQLAGGKRISVTRFDFWPSATPDAKSSVFVDTDQSVVRIDQPLLGRTLRLERCDAASALGYSGADALDLQFSSLLPLKRRIANPERMPSVRLQISVGPGERIELPESDFQSVEQRAAHELIVTLTNPVPRSRADSSDSPNTRRVPDAVAVYLTPTRWINSDHPDIVRMGVLVAGGTSFPQEKCRRLSRHLFKQMRTSAFSTSLLPAAEVCRSLRGDCTEHAVLLCSLLRSQQIPARVCVGFVHVPEPPSFAPHMWTEAWIDDQWLPLDSTRGADFAGTTHLKVLDSALTDEIGGGAVLFVPLLRFLGRAEIDVVPP